MTYKNARRVNFGAISGALFSALQWRLLLLWLLLLALPTAVAMLPLWGALGNLLDHSVHAEEWGRQFHMMVFDDVLMGLRDQIPMLHNAMLSGLLLTLLLAPFLTGMVVGAGRAGRALGFGQLLQSGIIEYGRMFRLMLWSLLPLGIAVGLTMLGSNMADEHAEKAVLESQVVAAEHAVQCLAVLAFVLMHAVIESARAAFIADVGLRSATRALGRGFMQLLRRPLSTLFTYVLVSLIGYLLVLSLGMARIQTVAVSAGGFVLALLLAQLIVAVVGWTRTARLFALAEVSASLTGARRAGLSLEP
ncbi:hypothetical protein [Dyella subtropica]|uniref:hypothetical protein n=1 Tax=Dyella subtropica TaxID=2992127 RepID=UPI002255114D|nr:hypothetical protein [Dyella subtropica]